MSRRTASAEPVGFPGVLLRREVRVLVALDDCASLLFLTAFFDAPHPGAYAAIALAAACGDLREMTVTQARDRLARWQENLRDFIADPQLPERGELALARVLDWLAGLSGARRPWSTLDWATCQLGGGYCRSGNASTPAVIADREAFPLCKETPATTSM
jgi:hypothetical protein